LEKKAEGRKLLKNFENYIEDVAKLESENKHLRNLLKIEQEKNLKLEKLVLNSSSNINIQTNEENTEKIVESFSWKVDLNKNLLEKTLDKSVFLGKVTGIPRAIREYIGAENLIEGKKEIKLIYKESEYTARFEERRNWIKLHWNRIFHQRLEEYFELKSEKDDIEKKIKELSKLKMIFQPLDSDKKKLKVWFVDSRKVES
jgi:hypothetical protein